MNDAYRIQMKSLLKEECETYFSLLSHPAYAGFRINPLKSTKEIVERFGIDTSLKSPFAENGYYWNDEYSISNQLLYHPGHIYSQEPSASSAVSLMQIKPSNEIRVLDLCAAPGSKGTQIAEAMKNKGLLVLNEIHPARCRILVENVSKHGITNAVILNDKPEHMAQYCANYFDYILCDAPCSGEGMMRKEPVAQEQWSKELVKSCALRQRHILESAYRMLKPGGVLVYSTCTFNTEENEETVVSFLKKFPDMKIDHCEVNWGRSGFDFGYDTIYCHRIFPMDKGEGHFACRMVKEEASFEEKDFPIRSSKGLPKEALAFLEDYLETPFPYLLEYNKRIYGGTNPFYDFQAMHLMRQQVFLGEMKQDRFEPSHSLVMNSKIKKEKQYEISREEVKRYLSGESLFHDCTKGYYALSCEDVIFGFGKSDGKQIKNKYPKELRQNNWRR